MSQPDQILSVSGKAMKAFGLALLAVGLLELASCALRAFS
jgi:hypothetical protein